ncbi:outer membrane autotransporter protein [Sphingomonas kyeonggiensis]|uniref:Outer membrane autotransporter protein n=1 Tax=Sphingomonas kyeonggiensis TaxID=1268553 RepID=A0A7W7K1Y5_9SPHN|nr:autotransporter domain-containing protein [Sphingomonas kyeonggiensis]MBB4839202.1 outer membrane autotransporter protein [Sphingomonas kyeonggiensis]
MQHQFLKARSARLVRGSASLAALAVAISLAPSMAHAQRITQGGGRGAWITGQTIGQGGIAGGGGGASRGTGGSAAQTPDGTASAGGISSGGAAGGQPGTPNDIAAGGGGTGGSSAGATGGDGGAGNLVTATGNFAFSIDYVGGDGGIGAGSGSGASAGGGGAGLVLTGTNVQVTTQGYDVTGGNGGRGSGQGSGGGGGAALVLLNGGSVTVAGGAGGAFSTITGGIGQEYGGSGAGIFLYNGGTLTIRNGNKVTGGEGGTFTADGGTGGGGVLSNLGTVVNEGAIAGGEGGYGYSRGGRAGDGVQAWGGTIENRATGTIVGGRGGYNNSSIGSNYTGNGGAGVRLLDGQAATLTNAGEINGGAGGPRYAFGTGVGAGGMGVVGAAGGGSTIINSGIIRGGVNASSQRNLAIGLYGSNNRLELRAGSYMDGGVVVAPGGTNNVFALGGSTDDSFDVSQIGEPVIFIYYKGFDTFEKSGTSTWTLTGTGNQDWRIAGGNLAGDTNSLGGNLTFTSAPLTSVVAFNQNFDGSYAGTISGTGTMLKMGSGTVTLNGSSSVDWAINQGGVIADAGGFTGNAKILAGASLTFNQAGNASYAGTLLDAGDLHKTGSGRLTLTGDSSLFTGTTFVDAGTLVVNGRLGALGSSVTVASGATVGGSGTIGRTTVQSGGHLAPGNSIGTLNVVGGLTVAAGGNLDFELGQPDNNGPTFSISDRIIVSGGDLALDGTINLSQSGDPADGAAGIGYYRLISYYGALTSNTAVLGTTPGLSNVNYELRFYGGAVDLFISPSLIVGDDTLQHWQGGDGSWDAVTTQWLNQGGTAPASWAGNYAVFKDDNGYAGGTITVAGAQSFLGLQFVDNGYVLQGSGQLVTDPAGSEIRVLADSAEIASQITGPGGIVKTEAGTLILTGTNSYSGTTIQAGTLQIGNGGTTGSITNNVVNNGTLAFARSDETSFDGIISGTGAVRVLSGDVTLTGDSSYSGGTGIATGATLRIGSGTSGSIGGDVANDGTLAFTRSDATSFGGTISGAGAVQFLSGSVTLTANNGYTGGTGIANGATLQLGRGSTTGSITGNVANAGTLAFGRSDEIGFGGVISGTGAVRILSGGVALTADNGYTGGTSIANGAILQIGNGGTTGSIVGTVANDGTLAFARSDAGSLGGRITGSGAVQVLSGSLTLTADNSYTGGTGIATGATLQLGSGGTTGSITGNVANSGTLAFARSSSNNFAGTITGSGAVRILTGSVTFISDSSYTGGTSIAAGATLQLGDAGTTGGITGNVANAGTLAFNRANNLVFAGVLSGAGSIRQAGSGKTELTGDSSGYTGTTSVAAGTLAVNGKLGGTLTVLAAGRLQGTGTVGNTIVSGTIAPGNSIGTLNVAGNIVFNTGSTYEVEADAAGLADRIVATGTATLNGGTVSVLAGAGNYRPETSYLILHADGGIAGTGRFGGVTSNLAFLDPSLSYDGNNVYLRLRRNDISFASVGATPNQVATGTATQGLGWNSPVFAAVANLSAEQARAAFDQLSGEIHASARTAMIEDSRFLRDAATDRLRTADAGFAIWGNGFGSWGHWAGDGNAARLNRSVNGFVLGADAPVLGKARLGLVGSYDRASFDTRAHGSSGTRDSYGIGIYGGADLGAAAVRIGVSHGWHKLDTTRLVAFPGFTDSLKGEQDARTTQVFGELAYRIALGATRVEPFADFAHVWLNTDGATEKGGASALRIASGESGTSFTTLGLRAAPSVSLGSAKFTARGALGWRHAFGDVTPLSAMQFASGGDSFRIAGTPIARNAAALDAGIDVALTSRATLGIAYGGQFGSSASDQSVRASFRLRL